MEALLVLTVLAVGFIFAIRSSHSDRNTHQHTQPPTTQQTSSHRPSHPASKTECAPFDEKSAKKLHQKQILSGAAWVTDGDTIKIKNTQIRLFGIDAPELNHPYGKKAKWELHRLCKGHTIRAEITEEDEYGRTVARCYLPDGRDLSAEMVKLGLAIDWPKFSGGIYSKMEQPDVRKKLFLADARQKGRMYIWERYEARQNKA